ncbi:MAG: hypothetical protein ABIN55_05065 [Aeromicrobium sp.]
MDADVLGLLLGTALGIASVFLVRRLNGEPWMYAYALLVLPFIYIVFAVVHEAPNTAGKEFVAGLPWIVAGIVLLWFKVPYSTMVVGAFWILHAIYDVVHDDIFINSGVPDWYPFACFGTDIVIGGYLLWLAVRENSPAA